MTCRQSRILCLGGLHWDTILRCQDKLVSGESNPVCTTGIPGGVAFNVATALSRLGSDVGLTSRVGRDKNGRSLYDHLESNDIQPVALEFDSEAPTGSYTAVLDLNGELVIGLADMAIYDRLSAEYWQKYEAQLQSWDAWCVDSNLSGPALESLAMLLDSSRLYAVATSPAKSHRLGGVLTRLNTLFLNTCEAAVLSGRESGGLRHALQQAQCLRDRGLKQVVITAGAQGVAWADCGGCGSLTAPIAETGNLSGAGDALAAATIAALEQDHSLRTAARWGLSAGIIAAQPGPSRTALSWHALEQTAKLIDD